MAAKTTSRMKEARLLLVGIPKLLAPFLLFAVTGILHKKVKYLYTDPLIAKMSHHLNEMEDHTDHSSPEYARLLEETQHDATEVLVIFITVALVTHTLAFAKQIVSRSAATSTTDSGYSLAALLREVTKWHNLKPALVTTAAFVAMSQLVFMALLGASFPTAMHDLGLLSVQGSLLLIAFLTFLFLGVMALTIVGVTRKECSAMVLATLLLPTLLIPVCALGLLHLHTKRVMVLGPSLLSVYDLLQTVQDQLYSSAALVYCYKYQSEAGKETMEKAVAKSRYFTYPILFVSFFIILAIGGNLLSN